MAASGTPSAERHWATLRPAGDAGGGVMLWVVGWVVHGGWVVTGYWLLVGGWWLVDGWLVDEMI